GPAFAPTLTTTWPVPPEPSDPDATTLTGNTPESWNVCVTDDPESAGPSPKSHEYVNLSPGSPFSTVTENATGAPTSGLSGSALACTPSSGPWSTQTPVRT